MSDHSPERRDNEGRNKVINCNPNANAREPNDNLVICSHTSDDSNEMLSNSSTSSEDDGFFGVISYIVSNSNDCSANCKDVETEIKDGVRNSLLEVTSPEDQMRRRDCLVKAVSEKCKDIIDHDMSERTNEMSLLEKCGCINSEDKQYLDSKSDYPIQRMRALFSMILDRDLKTLLTFIWILKLRNTCLFKGIFSSFIHSMHIGYRKPMMCLQCVLIERVNIRLIADFLDACINKRPKFYQKVSEAKMSDSEGLWKEFFDEVNARSLYSEASFSIIRAIVKCGFHSDILSMFASDSESKDNCFKCRCHDIRRSCSISSSCYEQTSRSTQTSYCSDSRDEYTEAGTYHAIPVEDLTDTHCCAESRRKVCIERHMTAIAQNSLKVKIEARRLQSHTATLKRKNSDMEEDGNVEERPKKKPAESSGINLSTDHQKESETSPEKTRSQEQSSKIQDNKKESGDNSAKGDGSLENLRMENLKIGVRGYESDHDSGFSPYLSPQNSNDSDITDKKTASTDETIPKQVFNVPNALSSQNERSYIPESQYFEDSRKPNGNQCLDAECTELGELQVNKDWLKKAFEDLSDVETDKSLSESPSNRSLPELDEKQNGQSQSGL